MNLYPLARYAVYLLSSGHRKGHGIHSPFLFNVVSGIFQNKTDPEIVFKIETLRKKMKKDKRVINFRDYGSRTIKREPDLRRVSDIAKHSPVSKKYGQLLFRLSSAFGKQMIIEFGTSLGISTMYLAFSRPDSHVYTMEGCQEVSEIARENFREAGLSNIILLTGRFEDLFTEIRTPGIRPGLVFIDGNHRQTPTLDYFNLVAGISGDETVVVLDDIYHSPEMAEAWGIIRNDGRVTATIDIFKMGIVFFRRNITPGSYLVRY